jgi:hypothetical protein
MQLSLFDFRHLKIGQKVKGPYCNGIIYDLKSHNDTDIIYVLLDNNKSIITLNHKDAKEFFYA